MSAQPTVDTIGLELVGLARRRRSAREAFVNIVGIVGAGHARAPSLGASPGPVSLPAASHALAYMRSARIGTAALVAASVAGTVVVRLTGLRRSLGLFEDEAVYARVGHDIANGLGVTLFQRPFYVHPPGFFFLEAALYGTFGVTGSVIDHILFLRHVELAFAAVSALLVFLIARRLAGVAAAAVAAGLFMFDPLALKMNSEVLLETPAMTWALGGVWVIVSAPDRRLSWRRALLAGGLFGLAVLTKEVVLLVTVGPLLVALVAGWVRPRAAAALAVVSAAALYALYPLGAYLTGTWPAFAHEKLQGVQRLLGLAQITGFNAPGSPLFRAVAARTAADRGPTYVLLAAGVAAAALLLRSRDALARFVGAWCLGSAALAAYALFFGTNEEQVYYLLVVPSTVAVGVVGGPLIARRGSSGLARGAAALALTGLLLWGGLAWQRTRSARDDGYERLAQYLSRIEPRGQRVAIAAEPDVGLLLFPDETVGQWNTVAALRANRVGYVITVQKLDEQGYSPRTPAFLGWVRLHGKRVLRVSGPSTGALDLYRIPSAMLAGARRPSARAR